VRDQPSRSEGEAPRTWQNWLLRLLPGLSLLCFFGTLLTGANPFGGLLRLLLLLGMATPVWLWLWQGGRARLREGVHGALLAAILAAALFLRLQGIGFGLPYYEQPDEWNTVDWAIEMVQTADYTPRMFTYPPAYTYLQAGMVTLHYLRGASAGLYSNVDQIQTALYYPWGRSLTALLGTASIFVTYLLGRRIYGREVGLLAAAALAFFPPHMRDSQYATTDIPLTFFSLLAMLSATLLLYRKAGLWGRLGQVLLTGALIGLAAATKYTVATLLLPLAVAAAYAAFDDLDSWPARAWRMLGLLGAGALGVGLGFTLGNPYWLALLPQMLTDIGMIFINYKLSEPQYQWEFFWGIARQDANLLTLSGALGIAIAGLRHRRGDLLLLCFFLPYLVQIANVPIVFFRNAQPIVPLLFIFAGLTIVSALELVRERGWLAALLARIPAKAQGLRLNQPYAQSIVLTLLLVGFLLGSFVPPAQSSIVQSYAMAQPTTRMRATDWVLTNVPQGSRIWLEDQTLILPSDQYRVAGGKPIRQQPIEWYADQGYSYLVANVSRTPSKHRDELRAMIERAGVTFKSSPSSLGEEFAVIQLARLIEPASDATKVDIPFGSPIVLEAYKHPGEVQAGGVLPLAIYWRCILPVGPDYIVYVHLVDEQGNKLAQRDIKPLEGTRPTPTWQVGELLRDDQDLFVPAEVPPGTYRLEVGMYLADTFARLNEQPVYLGEVTVK
jgi:4-amino-4-deoxy-L-arabinose transferase-like glycosyltransferase